MSSPTPRLSDQLDETVRAVLSPGEPLPDVGLVLGSGLGAFAEGLEDARVFAFAALPHFPKASVEGHAGRLVLGRIGTVRVAVLQGRVHGYEGHPAAAVAYPVRVLCRMGIRALVLTNAAGCVRADWAAGDFMRITDHINLTGQSPLTGPVEASIGPRFPDLTRAWDARLGQALEASAAACGVSLRSGVYAGLPGPAYETPAEVRMLRMLGADAVGMSTVHEVVAAAHMGVPVAGLSCLTNLAAGLLPEPLSHAEVTRAGEAARDRLCALLSDLLPRSVAAVG